MGTGISGWVTVGLECQTCSQPLHHRRTLKTHLVLLPPPPSPTNACWHDLWGVLKSSLLLIICSEVRMSASIPEIVWQQRKEQGNQESVIKEILLGPLIVLIAAIRLLKMCSLFCYYLWSSTRRNWLNGHSRIELISCDSGTRYQSKGILFVSSDQPNIRPWFS